MSSFLSNEQAEMLRDELARLKNPNDPGQIELLISMSEAIARSDKEAFENAWKSLQVGFGVRATLWEFLNARINLSPGQAKPGTGGAAKPPDPEELSPEAKNAVGKLKDHLDAILPRQPEQNDVARAGN